MDEKKRYVAFEDGRIRVSVICRLQAGKIASKSGACVFGQLEPITVVVDENGECTQCIEVNPASNESG